MGVNKEKEINYKGLKSVGLGFGEGGGLCWRMGGGVWELWGRGRWCWVCIGLVGVFFCGIGLVC